MLGGVWLVGGVTGQCEGLWEVKSAMEWESEGGPGSATQISTVSYFFISIVVLATPLETPCTNKTKTKH